MTQRATLALLVLLVGMLGWVGWQQHMQQAPTLLEITEALRSDRVNLSIENRIGSVQTIENDVTGQSGTVYHVTTVRNEGESIKDWKARHQEAIDMARSM